MNTIQRSIAALQLVLIAPAALFLAALLARSLSPQQAGPAQQIVMWYAGRVWTLWILLIALPLATLVAGGAAMLSSSQPPASRPQLARRISVAATVASGVILVVVALHMLVN